jgi:hypothetical protein
MKRINQSFPTKKSSQAIGAMLMTIVFAALTCRADDSTNLLVTATSGNYFGDWFTRVSQTQAEQPHWITPMATVTPRLEEEYRYDQMWEKMPASKELTSYGAGKGLELIPAEHIELILGIPAYQYQRTKPTSAKEGWTDDSFLVKYRILSGNAENGDYILTAFLGLGVPTGSAAFTTHHYIVTPTIAAGKGWGNFDVQSTFGVSLPDNGSAPGGGGTPLVSNTAFQYRIMKNLWPELEVNYTHWPNGEHEALANQAFLTPGLVVGKIPLWNRLGLTVGAAYQIAVTSTPLYRHNFILSARFPF